jgi:hypothetical protein
MADGSFDVIQPDREAGAGSEGAVSSLEASDGPPGRGAEAAVDVYAEATYDASPDAAADSAVDGPDAAHADGAPESSTTVPLRYVQGTAQDYNVTGAATISFALPVSAGDAILVAVDFDSTSAPTVVDSLGNSFGVVASASINNSGMYLVLAENIAGGADEITVNIDTPSSSYFELYVHEYAGLALSGALDAVSSANGTSSDSDGMSGGPVATSRPGDLIFGYGITGEAAAGTGFTVRLTYNYNITEDQIAGPPGMYAATATMLSGTNWQMITAAFRAQ